MKKIIILSTLFIVGYYCTHGQAKLELEGAIVVKGSELSSPKPGTIRFNATSNDFEGWNGQWVSLTGASGPTGSGEVFDIDGNRYLTVTIGTQEWMRENLRTSRYRNGDPIKEVILNIEWMALNTGAWCWYDHDPEKDRPYGKLYNWHAVNDERGLCPTGWQVPSEADWTALSTFLGGPTVAGRKIKTTGTIESQSGYWRAPNEGATNESGFTGLPGGQRFGAQFRFLGIDSYWWSATAVSSTDARGRSLDTAFGVLLSSDHDKRTGKSVRCLKFVRPTPGEKDP